MAETGHILRLAMRELRHGWKHFAVFVACLTLGVAIMASVGSIGATTQDALEREAKSLLGGSVEVSIRGVAATEAQREFLDREGRVSYVSTLRSMLRHGDESTLVEVKAIDDAYPLIGELELHESIPRQEALAGRGLIVDPILLTQLDLELGDTVTLGTETYTIRATLKTEPDRVVQIFTFGPRVMVSHEALEGSGLINTFSLIEHSYRILRADGVIGDDAYKEELRTRLNAAFPETSWRLKSGTDGNAMVQRFTDQLLAFLALSGLATFLIAGIGIGSSARAYLEKKSHAIAVFKIMGAPRRTVFATYATVLGLLALAGGLLGNAIAATVVLALVPVLATVLPALEGHPGLQAYPFFLALWYGILIAYLFSLPALLSALNVRPSLLFRSATGRLPFRLDRLVMLSVATLAMLLFATLLVNARDPVFLLGAVAVMVLAFLLFGGCAVLVRRVARRLSSRRPWLRLAFGNLHRPGSTTGTVIYAIGISLTVLIALTLTEANFQSRITKLVEEEAPTLFMIDIQPHQQEGLYDLLNTYASQERIVMYPMVRGRISKINGAPVSEEDVAEDVRWAVRGDRGLSQSARPPGNAELISGEWWPPDYKGPPQLSVDSRFVEGMGLALGDTLTLNVLGEDIDATVVNARDIDYTTFQINFSLMLSPGALDGFPRTYLATVHLRDQTESEAALVREISRAFPGVTIIRTTEVVNLVRDILLDIATALRVTVGISLIAGLLVLTSALSATLEQRLYDTAVLKVLGARRSDILKSCTAEWLLLACITALIAAGIGTLSAYLITERFRGPDFAIMPEVTLVTLTACMVVIWLTGYLGNRRLFTLRPAALLRNE